MVSLIILLLGLFTAGLIVAVFVMTVVEFRHINGMTKKHHDTSRDSAFPHAEAATPVDHP